MYKFIKNNKLKIIFAILIFAICSYYYNYQISERNINQISSSSLKEVFDHIDSLHEINEDQYIEKIQSKIQSPKSQHLKKNSFEPYIYVIMFP